MNMMKATWAALLVALLSASLGICPAGATDLEGPQAHWADFDGDGVLDLLLTGTEAGTRLLVDRGGVLEDWTERVSLSEMTNTFGEEVMAAATVRCSNGLIDQRSASNCIKTSSVPQAGKLYPLSTDLNVSFAAGAIGAPSLEFFGTGWPYQLGFAVDEAGDINGDGTLDIIVGIPNDSAVITSNGRADVYSGLDGSLLQSWSGTQYQAYHGDAVSGVGDVDGDGVDDVVVGEVHLSTVTTEPGYAFVYSGATGATIHTFSGDNGGDELGAAVDGMGDLNGDGRGDILVGAPVRGFTAGDGYARVYSGINGSVLFNFADPVTGTEFGTAVANAGDVNNDGKADIVVGAPAALGGLGQVTVYSGANGSVLYVFQGDVVPDYLGFSVDGAGDVNNDGFADIIAGAPFGPTGFARVYSGKDGTTLHTFYGSSSGDYMGRSVKGVGTLDGDAKGDLLVGAPQGLQGDGYARLYSGATGAVLLQFDSVPGAQEGLGLAVGHLGTNLIISSPNDDTGANNGGAVRVYPTQYVGMGTTSPGERLTVAGIVASDLGGFKFPDGTVQAAANTPGPPGPQGVKGPKGPSGPQGPTGGGVQSINGLANKPLNIVGGGAFNASASGNTITLKYGPTTCQHGSKAYSEGAICYTSLTNCPTGIGWRATKRTCQSSGSWQNSTSTQCFYPAPAPICGQ